MQQETGAWLDVRDTGTQNQPMSPVGNALSAEQFRELFAWALTEEPGPPHLTFLWPFDRKLGAEDLWSFVGDTSTVNAIVGFPEMKFEERDGVMHGSTIEGIASSWVEVPWNWNAPYFFSCLREYDSGPPLRYHGIMYAEEFPHAGITRMYVYTAWWLRNEKLAPRFGRHFERYREGYGRFLDMAERRSRGEALDLRGDRSDSALEQDRRREVATRLTGAGADGDVAGDLARFVAEATETDLSRIRPRRLAKRLKRSFYETLETCLYSVRAGVLTMKWELVCPHCRAPKAGGNTLADIPTRGRCDVCRIDFEAAGDNSVEIVFKAHPSIRPAQRHMFCSREPADKPHIRIQQVLGPGESRSLQTFLRTGSYRIRALGRDEPQQLEVSERYDAAQGALTPDRSGDLRLAPMPELALSNPTGEAVTLIVEDEAWDADALRPGDLFTMQSFRDLIGDLSMTPDLSLSLGEQCLLFSDVVGSTALYEQLGDGEAFQRVREHFRTVLNVARKRRGALIKTMGDAAMLAFSTPHDAFDAALDMQRAFASGLIRLRISLCRGPCIAVDVGNGADYFGQVVNTAAKLQSVAEAGDIAMPTDFLAPRDDRAAPAGPARPAELRLVGLRQPLACVVYHPE